MSAPAFNRREFTAGLGAILLTTINLAYYQELMADMRTAIAAGTFADFRAAARESWARGDVSCS